VSWQNCANCDYVTWTGGLRGILCRRCWSAHVHRGDSACRALAEGLRGVCFGLALDTLDVIDWPELGGSAEQNARTDEWSDSAWDYWVPGGGARWLAEQAMPPGCVAPWERK
jgi:hypothetical protein